MSTHLPDSGRRSLADLPINQRRTDNPLPAQHRSQPDTSVPTGSRSQPADSRGTRPEGVNWTIVYEIRDQVSRRLIEELALRETSEEPAGLRVQLGRSLILPTIRKYREEKLAAADYARTIASSEEDAYAEAVDQAIFGAGRWQPLLDDPEVENITIRGWQHVHMIYPDRIEKVAPVADSDAELEAELIFRAGEANKRFSPTHPALTLNLGDRHRLHAFGFDISRTGPSIAIRQHKHRNVCLDDLVAGDNRTQPMMPNWVGEFLKAAVRARRSIIVGGDQGCGKTTLLRALGAEIPRNEAVGVIETDPELFLDQLPGREGWFINLLTRDGTDEVIDAQGRRAGQIGPEFLLAESLRQYLSRVIVGEVRSVEAATMFQAMQAGAGSLSSIHAQHPWAVIERLATAAAQQGVLDQSDAYRQISTNINLVIYIGIDDQREHGGLVNRYIQEIFEIAGFSEGPNGEISPIPATNPIYRTERETVTHHRGSVQFRPSEQLLAALRRHGWSPDGEGF